MLLRLLFNNMYHNKYLKYKSKIEHLIDIDQLGGNTKSSKANYIVFTGDFYYPNGGWADDYVFTNSLNVVYDLYMQAQGNWINAMDMRTHKIILDYWSGHRDYLSKELEQIKKERLSYEQDKINTAL